MAQEQIMNLTTRTGAWKTLGSVANVTTGADTDLAAATGYSAAPAGELDLLAAGDITQDNRLVLILYATADENATITQKIYGRNEGGPPQLIGSIVWTIGQAIRGTGIRYADTAVVTDTHLTAIETADSGNNRVVSVLFDATGYRYIKTLFTGSTNTITASTCLYRGY
jgi:hypothetical protein